ncbi:MAG: bifunctional [glutamate--ammonia ligase]-adenylyl-L-tyrosine phosphorylase/[glutamate--ammonia-ligase] adenylyltransferase, partial [Verrucomicrobiales bacterium]|nr:bifunctional [glutamate--ammonia ligase]-adenylyl-L-tyrosine phosphorylase/[glutamate--ammonia-ligase] adenylyltransferase [Verrucomicrobiales bacterium]
ELSDVADVCLEAVWRVCERQFTERFGTPFHRDAAGRWQRTGFTVLGMGKLGGQELNYSSDVDLLFVYSEEGQVFKTPPPAATSASVKSRRSKPPAPVMSNHAFFNRLAEAFIAEVTRLSSEGALYRVDMRLRPEGDAGPLCRSLASYENYYAQYGQVWERMMLIKARPVAGDTALGHEFLEMVQPFRFPRAISESVLREIAAMKTRTEQEVVREGELDRNVKLGRGGIREIEFIVQAHQLLHAGRQPFLQIPQTLPCLAKLAAYHLLPQDTAQQLADAYRFLRDVEHRLQMEANLQTHTLPTDPRALLRLARLMGFRSVRAFETARRRHTGQVRRAYQQFLQPEKPPATAAPTSEFPRAFDGHEAQWKTWLARRGFRDPDRAFRVLKEFVEGPGFVHVSARTEEMAWRLAERLFEFCPRATDGPPRAVPAVPGRPVLSDPDRVVTRLDSFISAYGARAMLFEMWTSNPALFDLLLLLFDRSEFLAETMIRAPELYDELVFSDRLRQAKSAGEILADLRHGRDDPDQFVWLRRYHEAELLRLGLRDILGLVDFEQNLAELSALADACLQYALEVVMRRHRLKSPPFVIVGLGKLGGCEINYGSDLDVVFVAPPGTRNLARLQPLAVAVLDLISRRTERGLVFHTDARLRPDGEKGLLVNTLDAFEEYYRRRAWLWEIQALTRTRPVAGDLALGRAFQQFTARLTNFSAAAPPADRPACFAPDWKQQIHAMRMRIEKERTPPGRDALAIKTGRGGLMDAEFIAQTLCLEHGWQEAHTLRALERGRDAGVLPDAERLLENYRALRRVEGILRRWSYEGETVLPDDPAPFYRVAVRCGFETPEAFRDALAQWRGAIREVYRKVFGATVGR